MELCVKDFIKISGPFDHAAGLAQNKFCPIQVQVVLYTRDEFGQARGCDPQQFLCDLVAFVCSNRNHRKNARVHSIGRFAFEIGDFFQRLDAEMLQNSVAQFCCRAFSSIRDLC